MMYMTLLAYAPLGALAWMQLGLPGDQSSQLLYGLAAGVAAGYVLIRQRMHIPAMYLYPVSGAAFGYLFLGQYVGGQMMAAAVGAALGYGLFWVKVNELKKKPVPGALSEDLAKEGIYVPLT